MRPSIHYALHALLTAAFLLGLAGPVGARNLALLVGVSGYPKDPAGNVVIRPLQGPRNDVTVMWRLLRANGFQDEDMTILADGLPASPNFPKSEADPTRLAILAAFGRLAQRAVPGDFVYIHLSSHGSHQASSENDPQPFGRNQVLLPLDTRKAGPGQRAIPNGILDVEIGKALDAIRAKGAHVWIVVDMCHAGDSVRAADPEGVVTRFVEPETLGISFDPSAPPRSATRGVDINRRAAIDIRPGQGSLAPLIGFFAVDPLRLSQERPFRGYATPLVGGDERLGVFTQVLHRVLATSTAPTYRGLANDIVRELQSDAGGPPLPVFSGDLDAPVFGTDGHQILKGWAGHYHDGAIQIAAGALHGVIEKSVVAIHKGGDDKAPEISRAVVRTAGPASSQADLISRLDAPTPPLAPNEPVWITLAEPAVSFVYRLSEPPLEDRRNDLDGAGFAAVDIVRQRKVGKEGIAADWRPPGSSDADILLRVMDGYIWLVPSTGEWPKGTGGKPDKTSPNAPPAIRITEAEQTADRLFGALWSLARAKNLVRIAGKFQTLTDDLVSLSVEHYPIGQLSGNDKTCPAVPFYLEQLQHQGMKIVPGTIAGVTHCNLVVVKVTNKTPRFVDAAVFYVDSRGGVQMINPASGPTLCAADLPPSANAPTLFPTKIVLWRMESHSRQVRNISS